VTVAVSSLSSGTVVAADADSLYFSTDAHYRSLAGRIAAALRDGGSLFLVTGDPPPSSQNLAEALRGAAGHSVIGIACGPELRREELLRAAPDLTSLPTIAGRTTASVQSPAHARPVLVFDEIDRLSDSQMKDIHEAMLLGDRTNAAAVLLARPAFLARLESPALRFLKQQLAAHFPLQELGPDERIAYLRHQLAHRHRRTETRRLPAGVVRGLAVVALVVAAGAVVLVLGDRLGGKPGEPHANAVGSGSTIEAPAPRPAARAQAPPETARAVPEAASARSPPAAALPPPVQPSAAATPAASTPPEAAAEAAPREPAAETAPPEPAAPRAPEAKPPVASADPAHQPAGSPPSAEETSALLRRGDSFLAAGDVASARLFYQRAADAGDAPAALRLGATFDPAFLARTGIRGVVGDEAQASLWYRRARDLREAEGRPKGVETRRLGAPEVPAH